MRLLRRILGMNRKARERLGALGYPTDPDAMREWNALWQFGTRQFWAEIDGDQNRQAQIRKELPTLQEYAAECRRIRPAPSAVELSPAEREQGRIIAELSGDLIQERRNNRISLWDRPTI